MRLASTSMLGEWLLFLWSLAAFFVMRMVSPATAQNGQPRRPPPRPKREGFEYRKWSTVNLTDARTDIEDAELFWLENVLTTGKGSLQIIPGPAAPIATLVQGIATLWGFTLNGQAIVIAVGQDGSLTQVAIPGGVQTVISGAGAVTTGAHLGIFQGTTVVIIDPVKGYSTWNGVLYTVVDAARVGESIASFEGRVWIGHNRNIAFTAPNSATDFTVGNGAGSVTITDEQFVGNITTLIAALEQLWIFSAASVNAISNVAASGVAPSVVTTFAITNIIAGVGANAPNSVLGYLRAIAFMSPGGIYALSGVTPQQLSEKLDGMFPALTLTPDVPAAVGLVQNLFCLLYLVTYTQANAPGLPTPANGLSTATPLVIGFTKGRIFFASQGDTLKWITTVIVNGVSQTWGADTAGHIFQLFGAPVTTPVRYKIVSKFYAFGRSDTMKALMKVGLELQATNGAVSPTLTVDSDLGSQVVALQAVNQFNLINSAGGVLTLINAAGGILTLTGQGLVLAKEAAAMFGHYLGLTITGTDPPYRIQALQMEVVKTRDFDSSPNPR